jgi:hypothetical protein
MDLSTAIDAFALRLYDWSLTDLLRELAEGCPLMSLVGLNNRYVAAFVSLVRTLSPEERANWARMLTRRTHERAATLRGEALGRQEQRDWDMNFHQEVSMRIESLPPLTTFDQGLFSFKPVEPNHCLESLGRYLSPILGTPKRRKLRIDATRKLGDWKLITEFTFYKPDRFLFFEYQFVREDGQRTIGHDSPFPRDLFMFYGLTKTSVVVPSQADSEPMAQAMAKLAEHFVAQAEALFSGLGLND